MHRAFRHGPTSRLLAGLGAAALLLLASCGSDDGAQDTSEGDSTTVVSTTAASPTTAAAPASSYPVTIEHKFGTTSVPSAPQRVVSLGYTEQDAIVLFGVQPIAVRYAFGPEDDVFFPWADEGAGDAAPEILPR